MKNVQLRKMPLLTKIGIFVLFAGLTFVGCDTTSNGGGSNSQVILQFQIDSSSANKALAVAQAEPQPNNEELVIEGNNGTLTINDIRFIVDDFELEKEDAECEDLEGEAEEACEGFETGLTFVDLPLNNEPYEFGASSIADGIYTELEFEIDDLDMDQEEDSTEQQEQEALLEEIRTEFPDWPQSASMIISGTFESNTTGLREFTTYASAEVSIESELSPPLEMDGTSGKRLTIDIKPNQWFTRNDGSVINLANYDYSTTQQLIDFEVEVENGFTSTEVEND